ncbi:ELL2 factor, partial [Piprites chloris]|nr:ELL2 factor [Piprites chloris]
CSPFCIRKYRAIFSYGQCQSYKDDFSVEYGKYSELLAQMDKMAKKFRTCDEQWKFVTQGSAAYQVKKDKTVK